MPFAVIIELVVLCHLLLLSAFFSGTETSLFSLSKLQVRRLRQQHPDRGEIITKLLEHPHRLLSTLLLGNTVVNITVSVLGYVVLEQLEVQHAAAWAVPIITLLLLLCGEVTPKSLAIRHPEYYAILVARPMRWIVRYSTRLRQVAEQLSGALVAWIERLPYFASRQARAGQLTEDEYRTVLQISERAGVLRKEERAMVNKILTLDQMLVKEIMTPRVDMQCVEDNLSRDQAVEALRRIKHRRVPVIHDTPDNVVGMLHVKDFLINTGLAIGTAMEPAFFVPETQTAGRLLRVFRKQEHPVAIVVDEYGGTAGIISLEDILEEIVGEIEDEFDASEIMVQKRDDRHYVINGKARLSMVNEICHTQLRAENADTIAGWLLEKLGSLPREGDRIADGPVTVTAGKVVKNRVREVQIETGGLIS